MSKFKKDSIAKVNKSIKKYLGEIKPKFSKNFTVKIWGKISELVYGLIVGQSCFLNTIAENTPHYIKKSKKSKSLSKCAQIEKLSGYLLFPFFNRLISSFLNYLYRRYFSGNDFNPNQKYSIKERVHLQKLALHDGSDIQKPYAKKMENLCDARDGSLSSAVKVKTGKGYLLEGSIAFYQGRLFPLLLNLYSYVSQKFKSEKEETKKNLLILKGNKMLDCFLHVFDRGYDCAAFMGWCARVGVCFLIRATMSRHLILQDEFHDLIKDQKTQNDKKDIFYSIETLLKKLCFKKHADYSWFKIAWAKVFIKGENYPKDVNDLIVANFISVKIIDKEMEGIDEDLGFNNHGKGEREIHLYTAKEVNDIDDAIVIFLCYLLRWKVETFFRFLKQVFGLEKVCLQSFDKINNMCKLLPIACCWLYKYFRKFEKIEEKRQSQSLKSILSKDFTKRDNETILLEIFYFCYQKFCRQKNLKHNPDSFAKFIHDFMEDKVEYNHMTIDYEYFDSG